MQDRPNGPDKKTRFKLVLRDAGQLIWRARKRLLLGLPLMFINRISGLVLPYTTKYLIDDVINHGRTELLWTLVTVGGIAAAISSATDYALAQLLGIAAQRSITDLRVKLQQHIQRLPVGYFDATKTGVLVTRVMSDAEGVRNLVGTGLVQLFGGLITSAIALTILFRFSARLASIILGMIL